jgi:hypothetical protein
MMKIAKLRQKEMFSILVLLSSDKQYEISSRILCLLRLSEFVLGKLEINKDGLNKSLKRYKYVVSGSFSPWGKGQVLPTIWIFWPFSKLSLHQKYYDLANC